MLRILLEKLLHLLVNLYREQFVINGNRFTPTDVLIEWEDCRENKILNRVCTCSIRVATLETYH